MKKIIIFVLAIIPFIAQLIALPLVNRIYPFIFGIPLLHFWLLLWMILTPFFTLTIYQIQKRSGGLNHEH
ncbi:DUF3311 domain-containing protein [Paenibacillus aestuarii]|uniref:DUF3311 domain-containing protein n=1 Tax=Paenibacillus aestuarii TaxID=516965 RepID=A0ABW0K888_9BACL|nr:DUF3311 domain-containing protein [Paenibacillus aestuarii]